ncbi:hypothetical protein MMC19_000835 [Ptychographa xylographoides]|nr:hypothetical protein [Ptychographa xylographoides]
MLPKPLDQALVAALEAVREQWRIPAIEAKISWLEDMCQTLFESDFPGDDPQSRQRQIQTAFGSVDELLESALGKDHATLQELQNCRTCLESIHAPQAETTELRKGDTLGLRGGGGSGKQSLVTLGSREGAMVTADFTVLKKKIFTRLKQALGESNVLRRLTKE